MSERFTLEVMGPVITAEMRAVREDALLSLRFDGREDRPTCCNPDCDGKEGFPHRSRTMYAEEASNWHLLCDDCAAEDVKEWDERWDELNADIRAGIAAGGGW